MNPLKLLYFFVFSRSSSRDSVDIRINPWGFIALLIQPTINSVLGFILSFHQVRAPVLSVGKTLYDRYDVWTYFSIALSFFISWLFFDRKREEILSGPYARFQRSSLQWWTIFVAICFWILSAYLYTVSYKLNIIVSVFAIIISYVCLSVIGTQNPNANKGNKGDGGN